MVSNSKIKEYLVFVAAPDRLPLGEPVVVFVKSLAAGRRKYDTRLVKAIVSRGDRPGAATSRLVLSSLNGRLYSEDLTIRIIEELGEYVFGAPYDLHTGVFAVDTGNR